MVCVDQILWSDKMIISVFFLLWFFFPKINTHVSSNKRDCHSQPFLKCTEEIYSDYPCFQGKAALYKLCIKGQLWPVMLFVTHVPQCINHELPLVNCTLTLRSVAIFPLPDGCLSLPPHPQKSCCEHSVPLYTINRQC